jgi:hypothetical protein
MHAQTRIAWTAMFATAAFLLVGLSAAPVRADDCVDLTPLIDMAGDEKYQGFPGGLYPDGRNYNSMRHLADGLKRALAVQPLDASGNPSSTGKIVLMSVGMSNTSQESTAFGERIHQFAEKNPALVFVNAAQGGQDARRIADPGATYWFNADMLLQRAGVTPLQVQAIWYKEAIAGPRDPFPQHAEELQDLSVIAAQIIKDRYPNARLLYTSSRIYAGYAQTGLNPEPYAYESGYSMKWMIEDQINGDPELNYEERRGEVKAPWMQWAAYLWADGVCGRSDGLQWFVEDFASDGTHPSQQGARKVADLLMNHFTNDPTTRLWFLKPSLRVLLGDMNGNGLIDGPDADAYLLYEVDPDEFRNRYPNVDPIKTGDINMDGVVNNLDLLEFIPVMIVFTEP